MTDSPTLYGVTVNGPSGYVLRIDTFDRAEADAWLARTLYHLREYLADYQREVQVRWYETEWHPLKP